MITIDITIHIIVYLPVVVTITFIVMWFIKHIRAKKINPSYCNKTSLKAVCVEHMN